MTLPLRIAILLCDSPLYATQEKYGSYGGVFRELLGRAAELLKDEIPGIDKNGLELTSWDVHQAEEYPELENIDAILMTGSRYNAFENLPWINKLVEFTKTILAQDRVRIIGVCFGLQIIGLALGMTVDRNEKGWELSVLPMKLTPTGQRLFHPSLKSDTLSIFQLHRDIVRIEEKDLPEGVENLGYTDVCQIQGMYQKGRFISVQGHPEQNSDILKEIIISRTEMGVFTKELAEDATKRLGDAHDGVAVACAFLRFLVE